MFLRTHIYAPCIGSDPLPETRVLYYYIWLLFPQDVLYSFPASVSSMAVHPISPYYVAFGLGNGSVQVLDRRMISEQPLPFSSYSGSSSPPYPHPHPPFSPPDPVHRTFSIGNQGRKITCIQFNQDGSQLLASYSEDYVYLFNSRLFGCGGSDHGIVKPSYFSHCESYSPAIPRKRRCKVGGKVHGTEEQQQPDVVPSPQGQGSKNNTKSPSKEPPAVKKLRLRGDWSDTGPEACPESEGSESQGRNLMNHMSRMFSQWIDMSLSSSDEQGQEGGVLSGALGRARRRINERRRRQESEQAQVGVDEEEGGSGRRVEGSNSSTSSSDNSFNLFEDREEELDGSGDSQTTNTIASAGTTVGSPRSGGLLKHRRKECRTSAEDGDERRLEPFNLQAQSSGECTINVLTTDPACNSDNKCHIDEGKQPESKAEDLKEGVTPASKRTLSLEPSVSKSLGESSNSAGSEGSNVVASPIMVESRALDDFQVVPSITVIEGETDSDDNDDDVDRTPCNHVGNSGDLSCDHNLKVASEEASRTAEDVVTQTGEDSFGPFMAYKGHRNARTMVCTCI